MTGNEIRETWLKFFNKKGHKIEPSAPLVPINDNTLLWINAGVAPLKKYFDGREKPPKPRLTNAQKCIRTNDIDNVGKTARHHTFFEMLGNFSIGDYFKKEAIEFAYELLFSNEYFGFPQDKIYITYYPEDLEAKKLWLNIGIKESHLIPKEDNFWEIGDGPCGPDTEVHFDRGETYDKRGPELIRDDIENDRYVEIWNIVFSQFNAVTGEARENYKELPNKNIDTGAGLERFACILQNTKTNFETDLFYPVIKHVEKITNTKYDGQMAFKVIADHTKALVFSISDGAVLSNEGRGYVLRRILRRAVKYGYNLGLTGPFIHNLVDTVVEMMKGYYPYLEDNKQIVMDIIKREEMKFFQTIADGQKQILDEIKKGIKVVDGKTAFKLYDTYGFPIELTLEYAEDAKISVDLDGFKKELEVQKERSRQARSDANSMASQDERYLNYKEESKFVGYEKLVVTTKVIKVFGDGVILKETPFYAFSGGQMSDSGVINGVEVLDVIKLPNGQHLHILADKLKVGDVVMAVVDKEVREKIQSNHSATHLLQQALKDVLGNHVHQQGSSVTNETLRFDFNNYNPISDEDILKIEKIVNQKIKDSLDVNVTLMNLNDAKALGAMALFSEKYGEIVRVVNMKYSIELCGGTHVSNTLSIHNFAILGVESIGSGIYRIEAITGESLEREIRKFFPVNLIEVEEAFNKSNTSGKALKRPKTIGSYQDIINIRKYIDQVKQLIKENDKLSNQNKTHDVLSRIDDFIANSSKKKLLIETKDIEIPILKQLVDAIYDKIKADVLFVINIEEDKATFICKSRIGNAGELVKLAASISNGSGGGKDLIAQGGTRNLDKLKAVKEEIEKKL